ncbi:LOW QUALITY PROTEIN: kallikrein-15 [Balaenoptera acutorostrata]|uniref:LOW QUALITY PROTEIN: kallikrein-15 n=1 Tax=Balaenoptera acutorostrata TaxID=9767 RepID=A0ABM3SIN7_BALAC|nr:LOW QUALITY PROTEIN: kallikrein-15 [Balaenoptera acutorostrata]
MLLEDLEGHSWGWNQNSHYRPQKRYLLGIRVSQKRHQQSPGPSFATWLLLTFSFLLTSAGEDDSDKVLRGDKCAPHPQPWQVALFEHGSCNCGGSRISPRWVLSAAHCQSRYEELRQRDGPEQLRAVSLTVPHARYEAQSHRHDIPLLRLTRPARVSTKVPRVPLPTRCPQPSEACVVSGWGLVSDNKPEATGSPVSQVRLPDTLHWANISIIWTTSCNKDYAGRLVNTTVCAGVEGRGTDSLRGSGDQVRPLVCGDVLQGIVSWGDVPCDTTTKPSVYTKVCSYLEWIKETMKRN